MAATRSAVLEVESFSFLPPKEHTKAFLADNTLPDFASLRQILLPRLQLETLDPSAYHLRSLERAIQAFDSHIRASQQRNFTFFKDLLPQIRAWALDYEEEDGKIPLLEAGCEANVNFTRGKIRMILSNAFFLNVLDLKKMWHDENRLFGDISLRILYLHDSEVASQRILCFLSYFAQAGEIDEKDVVSFQRHNLGDEVTDWSSLDQKIDVQRINVVTERMEDSDAIAYVNFANKALHIHKIVASATQEEVLFSACPEAFVGILFCEEMQEKEVIIIRNVRRFSEYKGYLRTFTFTGFYPSIRVHDILAMDATCSQHFSKPMVDRDLNKAYLAFSVTAKHNGGTVTKVSTSHWGCGAFCGEIHFKFLQQVCASSLANVFVDYSTFGDADAATNFNHLLHLIHSKQLTIGNVYDAISGFGGPKGNFYNYVVRRMTST